jgi:hypothetical protein
LEDEVVASRSTLLQTAGIGVNDALGHDSPGTLYKQKLLALKHGHLTFWIFALSFAGCRQLFPWPTALTLDDVSFPSDDMDTGHLSHQVTTIINQLHGFFDEIGLPTHERDERESELFAALSETLNNQLKLVAK